MTRSNEMPRRSASCRFFSGFQSKRTDIAQSSHIVCVLATDLRSRGNVRGGRFVLVGGRPAAVISGARAHGSRNDHHIKYCTTRPARSRCESKPERRKSGQGEERRTCNRGDSRKMVGQEGTAGTFSGAQRRAAGRAGRRPRDPGDGDDCDRRAGPVLRRWRCRAPTSPSGSRRHHGNRQPGFRYTDLPRRDGPVHRRGARPEQAGDAGAAVAWASSDVSVVSVDEAGLVTAVGTGTAAITAASGRVSGTATVTVRV
ncbi:Ig-like domain-containing protein [Candidatus Palauibacter sp.]|uniref:Ig-like domain-containing protein n=1 Tax=Candidatus Palauibacter sp. TaxID=3101350 RepID=UPI003B52678E